MPIDPLLVPFLGQPAPSMSFLDNPGALRILVDQAADSGFFELAEAAPEIASVEDVTIEVRGGAIRLRIYRPAASGLAPVHVFLHGGGWMVMSIENSAWDNICRERAALAEQVVVAVNYRKAPEHKFPVAVEDGYAALVWVSEHIAQFGGDAACISIGGVSAGANIAAAVVIKARDEGGPSPVLQLLEVPALDLRTDSPLESRERYGSGYALTTGELQLSLAAYLPSPQSALHRYASPLLAENLSHLPPALIFSAEYDVLADDGRLYAQRLEEAGVSVRFSLRHGHIHTSSAFTRLLPRSRQWRDGVIAVLRAARNDDPLRPAA